MQFIDAHLHINLYDPGLEEIISTKIKKSTDEGQTKAMVIVHASFGKSLSVAKKCSPLATRIGYTPYNKDELPILTDFWQRHDCQGMLPFLDTRCFTSKFEP